MLVVLLTRGEQRAAALFQSMAGRLPLIDEEAISRLVHRLAARLRELGSDRSLLIRAISWASANWLLDAASLWVFVAAFGHRVRLDGLLVSFGLAYVLAAIPVTPGGLGVVETVLTSSLIGFGTPRGAALFGVLAFRLINFWVPIPLGGLSYLSLQVDPGDHDEGGPPGPAGTGPAPAGRTGDRLQLGQAGMGPPPRHQAVAAGQHRTRFRPPVRPRRWAATRSTGFPVRSGRWCTYGHRWPRHRPIALR
jgi:hypothetical protein